MGQMCSKRSAPMPQISYTSAPARIKNKKRIEEYQAVGLPDSHISALLKLQAKFADEMKELGRLHKISHNESKLREECGPGQGLSPYNRWVSWVSLKVKMRAFNEKQKILQDLKRDRQAEKER
jgi:hypothetical protein